MANPKIVEAHVTMDRGGDYVYTKDGIRGKPFPSEGEAWSFDFGLKVMNKFMFMSHKEQINLINQLEIR